MTKPKRYKRYSAEFKREAIRRANAEGTTDAYTGCIDVIWNLLAAIFQQVFSRQLTCQNIDIGSDLLLLHIGKCRFQNPGNLPQRHRFSKQFPDRTAD